MRIPSSWKLFRLRDITYESRTRAIDENAMGLSVFGVNNQTGLDTNSRYFADKLDRYKIVKPGMFAYNPMRLNIGSIGYCDETLGQGLVSPDYVVFGCNENMLNSKYFSYCIQDYHWKKWVQNAGAGSVRVRIYYKDISIYPIVLPPLSEQHKIANILSTWDEAIENTEHLIDNLRQRKNGLAQLLLTGQVRFPRFDGRWIECKLEQVASKNKHSFTGGPFGSNLKASSYTSKGVRIIQLQNIGDGEFLDSYKIYTSEEKADELISCNIYPGDIILSKMGDPVARATIIPNTEKRYLMASDGIRLEIDKERFDTQFILESINASEFRKNAVHHSVGSTRQRISLGDLRSLPIKAPPLNEQKRISSVLQTCNQEIELHRQKLELLKQQKKSLMQKILSGQVRVKV